MKKFNNPITIIHFRITTHGLTNRTNCHPFLIDDSIGFAHNGIIDFVSDHKKKSDTIMFKREILQQLPDNFIDNDIIIRLIEESIGNSKLVFLNRKGEFRIANEHKGHWSMIVIYGILTIHTVKYRLINGIVDIMMFTMIMMY